MRRAVVVVAFGVCAARAFAQLPSLDSVYPFDATYVAPGGNVQQALDRHRVVRLGAGSYRGTVTLRSGMRLYGVPGTHVHRVVVEPGTRRAVLWKASPNLEFPPGPAVTKHNVFAGAGQIVVRNSVLDGNLFFDSGGVKIDLSEGGYLRNNRFIRIVMQGTRQLNFRGNARTPSYNNVFLWFNPLCPQVAPMFLDELQDVTFVGVDAELWLSKSKGAMFHTGRMGTLRIFGAQGGENSAAGRAIPILDTKAEEVQLYGLTPHCPKVDPNMILREGNVRLFTAGCRRYDRAMPSSNEFDFNAFEGGARGTDAVRLRGVTASSLTSLLTPEDRDGVPWERPAFGDIPDPAGDSWRDGLADADDHTAMLQKHIEEETNAILAPGTYYISEPLRITHKHGLIGAGMDRTVIIAKTPGMAMFRADGRKQPTNVTLANLTLQGGGVGLEIRSEDIKSFISRSYISHVQFREMSLAGIHVNMPKGLAQKSLDNNVLTRCIFYRCASGVKQTATTIKGSYAGFMDKNLFYECQFVECEYGLELIAHRANNLNSCVNCVFRGCRKNAVKQQNSNTTTFANCEFVGNGGDPVISSTSSIVVVSCRFRAGTGPQSLLPSQSSVEGSTFEAAGATRCTVVRNSKTNHFYNCSSNMPVGRLRNGMLTNNKFGADTGYSQLAVMVVDGKPNTLVAGVTSPSPQMLFGADLSGASAPSAKKRAPATKKARPVARLRRPYPDAVVMFDTLLRQHLGVALASGAEVKFRLQAMRVSAIVNAVDDKGALQVTVTRPRMQTTVAFKRLTYADRASLARAILLENDVESHSLVAFYALCMNDERLAREHLRACGSMAADVRGMFVEE